jgi:hypothetical protein
LRDWLLFFVVFNDWRFSWRKEEAALSICDCVCFLYSSSSSQGNRTEKEMKEKEKFTMKGTRDRLWVRWRPTLLVLCQSGPCRVKLLSLFCIVLVAILVISRAASIMGWRHHLDSPQLPSRFGFGFGFSPSFCSCSSFSFSFQFP